MEKNGYTVAEAAQIMGCTVQAVREQIKANKISGCSCIKKGKNWAYYIPKMALDAFKEVLEDIVREMVQEKIKKHLT